MRHRHPGRQQFYLVKIAQGHRISLDDRSSELDPGTRSSRCGLWNHGARYKQINGRRNASVLRWLVYGSSLGMNVL